MALRSAAVMIVSLAFVLVCRADVAQTAAAFGAWAIDADDTSDRLAAADIRQIGRSEAVTSDAFRARLEGGKVLFAACFDGPPDTLAADLSDALADLQDDAPEVLRSLVVRDGRRLPAVNATARIWVKEMLAANADDRVSVLLIVSNDTAGRSVMEGVSPRGRAFLILTKTNAADAITMVRFGPVDEILR